MAMLWRKLIALSNKLAMASNNKSLSPLIVDTASISTSSAILFDFPPRDYRGQRPPSRSRRDREHSMKLSLSNSMCATRSNAVVRAKVWLRPLIA